MTEGRSARYVRARTLVAAVVVTVLAGCGTRLSMEEIATAAGEREGTAVSQVGVEAPADVGEQTADSTVATGPLGTSPAGAPAGGGADTASGTGGVAGAPTPGPATGTPIRIGNIGAYSGVLGAIFSAGQPTAQAFAQWVNARGGLNGHPIEVITADDGGDPARHLSLAKNMVENQGVVAFMGNLSPFSAGGASGYLESKKVPVIGGEVINAAWTTSPMYFPQSTAIEYIERGLPRLGVAAGNKKFSIFYCGESTICTEGNAVLADEIPKAGGELVYSAQVSLAQPDFTAECLQARNKGATAIIVGGDGNTLSRAANSCAQQGYRPQWITLSLAIVDSIAGNPNLEGAAGTVGTFPWVATDTPAAKDFRTAMGQLSPNTELSAAASAVWASGLLLQRAGRALPEGKVSSTDLLEGLWSIKDDNLGGAAPPLTFTRDRPAAPSKCYFTMALKGGKWVAPTGSQVQC